MIRRHSPSPVVVSSGFVISPNNVEVRSSEQDVLVVDTPTEAPLFQQGDLVIVFPHTVIAAISVKSTMEETTIKSVINGLKTVRAVARDGNAPPGQICDQNHFLRRSRSRFSRQNHCGKSPSRHLFTSFPCLCCLAFANSLPGEYTYFRRRSKDLSLNKCIIISSELIHWS